MSSGSIEIPDIEPDSGLSPIDPTIERLRSRLTEATKDELVALVERLASSSEETAARIDYLTDPNAAGKALQRRISALRRGKSFIAYNDTREIGAEVAAIAEDIRADVLPRDPEKAAALAEKLLPRPGHSRPGGRLGRPHCR
jgi:hypothetical protein